MKMLAFEFSSPQRSVAVLSHRRDEFHESQTSRSPEDTGTHITRPSEVFEVLETAPGHTMQPLGMVERALKQAGLERDQIEGIVIGLGPGSYTGIRAAIALAQGWQLGRGVKLLGVSSAECVAAQAEAEGTTGKVAVVIDAQRGEFYLAGFEISAGGRREVSPLRLATLAEAQAREQAGEVLIGPEVTRWLPGGRIVFPGAALLARLAMDRSDFLAGEKLEPIYLRETTFVKAPPPRAVPL
jgi:tRNA threonylcarbamoyladenosine biosynthesis protein TsaB